MADLQKNITDELFIKKMLLPLMNFEHTVPVCFVDNVKPESTQFHFNTDSLSID